MEFETKNIRNVAVAGHSQTGKTTLLEQLLLAGGVLDKAATVESGKTVSSSSPEEALRRISIYACLTHLERKGCLLNIWDTPGASDFTGEVISASVQVNLPSCLSTRGPVRRLRPSSSGAIWTAGPSPAWYS